MPDSNITLSDTKRPIAELTAADKIELSSAAGWYGYFKPENFGDVETDAVAAINAADLAAQAVGGKVLFEPKVYPVATALTKRSNSSWKGVKGATKIQCTAGHTGGQMIIAANRSDFTIDGVTFDGSLRASAVVGWNTFTGVSNAKWINCRFADLGGNALQLTGTIEDAEIDHCEFDSVDDGVRQVAGAFTNLKITNNKFRQCTGNPVGLIFTADCESLLLFGNDARDMAGDQSPYYLTGAGFTARDVRVIGNTAIGQDQAFTAGGSADLFSLKDMADYTITGNTATKGGDLGIAVERSKNGSITANTCSYNNSNGIAIGDSTGFSITGNTCLNNSQDRAGEFILGYRAYAGIRVGSGGNAVAPCFDGVLTGNTCLDDQVTKTQWYGIALLADTHLHRRVKVGANACEGNLIAPYFNNCGEGSAMFATSDAKPVLGAVCNGDTFLIADGTGWKATGEGYLAETLWAQGQTIAVGDFCYTSESIVWVAETAGTTGATEPANGATTRDDGGVTWRQSITPNARQVLVSLF